MWDVTNHRIQFVSNDVISTHTSRVGCDPMLLRFFKVERLISTHTSRVGCDRIYISHGVDYGISTHTSRVGCDENTKQSLLDNLQFLLTHPVWDVTKQWTQVLTLIKFLLTHPVWDVTFRL